METPFHLLILKLSLAQKKLIRPSMQELGLSAGQPKILSFLKRHGECIQKELAGYFEIEPATVSKLLDNMEAAGLIERRARDKRAVFVRLTEKGQQMEEKAEKRFEEIRKMELSGFSEREKAEFISYLCRMYQNMTGKEVE
jgi:DNA-binding MarR family transcriptional regulator